ncbi:hypothetical protein DENSPDRAFT_779014 [Dentipellis sp. KUC8613]|nr:hypothetical protein DENSPDRAFT_779014 [Dentipellis sp. KUC8613]
MYTTTTKPKSILLNHHHKHDSYFHSSPESSPEPPYFRPQFRQSSDSSSSSSSGSSPVTPFGIQSRVAPQPIKRQPVQYAHNLATPPLTPDDGSDEASPVKQSGDALELLTTLFPFEGAKALPYAKSVCISSPDVGKAFDGVVVELPGKPKTLYVDAKSAEIVNLRESIVALLDLADEHLECGALVIALEKTSASLGDVLHSLMYVGGTVVTKPPFQVDPAYVLVGLEI